MRTVREVAAAVRLLQRDLEQLKKEWYHCSICADNEGCNASYRPMNTISDPVHSNHRP